MHLPDSCEIASHPENKLHMNMQCVCSESKTSHRNQLDGFYGWVMVKQEIKQMHYEAGVEWKVSKTVKG